MILLQTVPTHIQIDTLQNRLLEEIDGVLAIHEFHVWQLTGDRIIASAHIRCRNLHDYMEIAERVKEFFHNAGIHSTTIQPEFVDIDSEHELSEKNGKPPVDCMFICPPGQEGTENGCHEQTCCGPQKSAASSKKISNSDPNLFTNGVQLTCLPNTSVDARCSSPDLRSPVMQRPSVDLRPTVSTNPASGVTVISLPSVTCNEANAVVRQSKNNELNV